MNTETKNMLFSLKESAEDFEWYPTTDEMIGVVFRHCGNISSMLDVGAGDGRVLEKIDKLCIARANKQDEHRNHWVSLIDKYAIEMSLVHIENMPQDISIVGTDFRSQTLIDKKVDIVFCNPPYSEYEDWATKIIKEANAKKLFLIMPDRWTNSKLIEHALSQRSASSRVIWSGDFMDADRRARAKVDIVEILITNAERDYEREKTDPFDVWFTEYFAGFEKLNPVDDEGDEEEKPNPMREIVEGQNLIERLSQLYDNELKSLLGNYKTLSKLDATLLKEIGVSTDEIRKALKLKIEGLKNKYWQELFDNLDKVTNRLTSKSREKMLEKLKASCNIDFSIENAYALVIWVIKNANKYLDQQLIEVFKELTDPECIKNYKSNIRTWEKDRWRYKEQRHTHYTLEYRIITNQYTAIKKEEYGYGFTNNLSDGCHKFINDIFTIANNLGFSNMSDSRYRQWESNKEQEFYFNNKTLVKIRAFKNGNLHLKFNQDFIKTLNVEASRLLGWIRSPQEAVDEMGIDINFAKSKFKCNLLFGVTEGQKLLTA